MFVKFVWFSCTSILFIAKSDISELFSRNYDSPKEREQVCFLKC